MKCMCSYFILFEHEKTRQMVKGLHVIRFLKILFHRGIPSQCIWHILVLWAQLQTPVNTMALWELFTWLLKILIHRVAIHNVLGTFLLCGHSCKDRSILQKYQLCLCTWSQLLFYQPIDGKCILVTGVFSVRIVQGLHVSKSLRTFDICQFIQPRFSSFYFEPLNPLLGEHIMHACHF